MALKADAPKAAKAPNLPSRAQPIFLYSNFTNYLLALSDVVQSYLNTKIDKTIYTKSSRFFYNLEKVMKNIITFMFIFIVKEDIIEY